MKRQKRSKTDDTHDDPLKRSIIQTRNVIRKKFRDLHNKKLSLHEEVSKTYKPIIEPLETLVKYKKDKYETKENELPKVEKKEKQETKYNYMPDSVFKTAVASHRANPFKISQSNSESDDPNISGITPIRDDEDDEAGLLEDSIKKKASQSGSPLIDNTYGFRYKNGQLRLGNEPVFVKNGSNGLTYSIRKKNFDITPGLTDLLLLKNPTKYTEADLNVYKDMLVYTSAHKKNYSRSGSLIRHESNPKYQSIISSLFPQGRKSERNKIGGSLKTPQTKYKYVNKNGVDYVYWDDPNELVDRLRLLMASQVAGHTGHDNEIISIIEELREANIIK